MLLADHAVHLPRVGQAVVLVDHGPPYDRLFLPVEGQLRYCPGGAYLAAEAAVVLAVAEAGHEGGRVEAVEARLEGGGVEGAPEADLHALTAPDALGEELPLVPDAGRAEEPCLPGRGPRAEHAGDEEASDEPCHEDPPPGGEEGLFSLLKGETEAHPA